MDGPLLIAPSRFSNLLTVLSVVVVRVVLAFQLFSWRQTKTTAKAAAAWPMPPPPPDQGPLTLQTFDKFSSVANGRGADTAAAACQAPATL